MSNPTPVVPAPRVPSLGPDNPAILELLASCMAELAALRQETADLRMAVWTLNDHSAKAYHDLSAIGSRLSVLTGGAYYPCPGAGVRTFPVEVPRVDKGMNYDLVRHLAAGLAAVV